MPGAAELLVGDGGEGRGRQLTAGKRRDHAGVNRGRGFRGELLEDDRAHERGEVIDALRRGELAGTVLA